MTKGKQFISELKLYSDYMKWRDADNRYETWEEACDDVLNVHLTKYGKGIMDLIEEIAPAYKSKEFLVSQRCLQFRNEQILKNNCRLYNCSVAYCYSPDVFRKGFFMLLSGAGFGLNLKRKYVSQLPTIHPRGSETITFVIEDSIEGWCDAANAIISSYCQHPSLDASLFGKNIRFDYSLIRPEGSYISGGFKAPGHKGLKQSLERIEDFIQNELGNSTGIIFRPYIAYNIFMHLSNAVLSGGVRRSAMNVIFDYDDKEMLYAKTGDWRIKNSHFARSNNSVGMLKYSFTKELFKELISLNKGDNDVGFVLLESEDQMFNPCFEIGFDFYDQIINYNDTVIQMCNLCEINASKLRNKDGSFSPEKFYKICRKAAIAGTLQAGYTNFPYLGKQTEIIVAGEALLGVSITGWMNNLELFNPEILEKGAAIVVKTNKEVAKRLGINPAARLTCTKPSGNASVILQTASGIHPEHSKRYFRVMQLNKENDVAKWIAKNYPEMLEDSKWSASNTDYVAFIPCENEDGKFKDDLKDIDHLKLIQIAQNHWVRPGKNSETAYNPNINHNISNTVIIDNEDEIVNYIYNNQNDFVAVSFLSRFGDKDFTQAPFTSVLDEKQLLEKYGNGVLFASGIIVDGLHYFDDDLWDACNYVINRTAQLLGKREKVLLQKDWIRRVKKFAKNYFKGDVKQAIYCIKDVHLYHKWCTVNRLFKSIPDFATLLPKPDFINIDTLAAISCAGGACEIPIK